MSRTQWWLTALLILGVGLFLRLWQLGIIPVSLYWDEAAMLVDVKSVVQSGQDMHGRPWYQVLYPSYGDYKLPVYIWLASGVAKLAGVSEWSLRFPSVIAGLITIVITGAIAREIVLQSESKAYKKNNPQVQWWAEVCQLSAMAVVALSPWSILFSRTAFEGHVGQMFLALSVWCLLKASRRWWWVLAAAALGVLATYSYFSVRFVWPVVAVAWLSWSWWQLHRGQFKFNSSLALLVGKIVIATVVFGVGLIPMMKSPLYADSNAFRLGTDSILKNETQILTSNVYREMAGNTVVDRVIFHRGWLTLKELFLNYSDHLSLSFLFVSGDSNLRHGTGQHGLFLLPLIVPLAVGFVSLATRRRTLLLVLGMWWLIALLPASVPQTTPHALRSLNALVPLSLLLGWGVGIMIKKVWQAWEETVDKATLPPLIQAWVGTFLMVGYCLWVSGSLTGFMLHYFKVYPLESAPEWQQQYREVALAMERVRAESHAAVVVLPFDDRFYLWSMAYGPYTAQDFHSWKSEQWQFRRFADINFTAQEDWYKLLQNRGEVVLVGRSEQVENELEERQLTPSYQEDIHSVTGQELYTVAVLKQ